jgi:glycosyltransferase involved in cell wall biosynthesis
MVLAHNEERHIEACIDSIFAADPDCRFEVYVMANGCSDATEDIVRAYSRRRPEVHLVSITLGDKCNAWNVFIHDTVPNSCLGRDIYFFMDGDATAASGAFKAMARGLMETPYANAAAAVPFSGRNAERDREAMLKEHALVANLYALRGDFVERLRAQAVRVPLKLEGDDGMIGAFVKWDLKPTTNGTDDKRIVVCADAGFRFESFTPTRLSDWKVYWKRAVRYGRRNYEFRLLGPLIESQGMSAVPVDVTDVYRRAEGLSLRWQGPYTLTNWVALRQMRHIGRQRSGA